MKRSLRDAVRKQVESVHLSNAQLELLNGLQANAGRRPDPARRSRRWWYPLAGAAALVALTVALLLPGLLETPGKDTLVAEIAAEVVQNHLHSKPLEVESRQLDSIRDYFTRLDFAPVASDYLKDRGLTLLGGRYCSLQGVTAAQLRFKSVGADTTHTLYQVGYDPEVFKTLPDYDKGETPITLYSSGVKVTLWVEKGVLFALTED